MKLSSYYFEKNDTPGIHSIIQKSIKNNFIFELAKLAESYPNCEIFSKIFLSTPIQEEGNECPACYRSEKKLFPYDCFLKNDTCKSHILCIDCYTKVNKCPICRVSRNKKNDIFCNTILE